VTAWAPKFLWRWVRPPRSFPMTPITTDAKGKFPAGVVGRNYEDRSSEISRSKDGTAYVDRTNM